MRSETKRKVLGRLRRVEGQVSALTRMVDRDDDCVDVLLQIAAAQGALGKAGQLVLDSHVRTCVRDAFAHGDDADRERKVEELMEVFGRYGRVPR